MLAVLAAVIVVVCGAALVATGALDAGIGPGLPDPGLTTRLGLPAVQSVRDLAAAITVGGLVLALWCVPGPRPGKVRDAAPLGPARSRLVALASIGAAVWLGSSLALAALVYSDASGQAWSEAGFWRAATFYARSYPLGQYLLWGAAISLVVSMVCARLRSTHGLAVVTALSLAGLWPIALAGHGAGTLSHDDTVTAQAAHVLGVSVWLGGLVGLVVVRRHLGAGLTDTVRRYSTVAGVALVLVGASGVVGVWLRVPRIADMATPYGGVVALKVLALVILTGVGWWHRRRLLPRLAEREGTFRRLVAAELVVLASAAGLGVALGRTPPPSVRDAPLSRAESLLGGELPGPLTSRTWWTAWDLDLFWLPVAVVAVGTYVAAVARLRRRGDRWSVLRLVSWAFGWALLVWATSGPPGAYGRVLFSAHMVQHMTIATAVPTFLVVGAPITLLLRATTKRTDGSSGPRELVQRMVTSLPIQVMSHPVVAAGSFVVSMVAFYYSSAFPASLESHTAHLLMTAHFLISGYLFAEVVIGSDPGILRPAYPLRALLVMVTFGFHALFAVSLMAGTTVLAEDWFASLGRTWGRSLPEDQELGAGLGWVLGEYPLAIMAVALLVSWVRADGREQRRLDRRADRDGDADLAAYNLRLQRLGELATSSTMKPRTSRGPRGASPQSERDHDT